MAHPAQGSDRRKFGRKPCHVKALIKAAKIDAIPCLVLDYSEGGARLELASAVKLPSHFDLCFDELNLSIPCELRHMFGRTAGIQFTDHPGRRSLSSAFGTEKFLNWLARDERGGASSQPGKAPPVPLRVTVGHPLRCSLLGKTLDVGPDVMVGVMGRDHPTTLTLQLIHRAV